MIQERKLRLLAVVACAWTSQLVAEPPVAQPFEVAPWVDHFDFATWFDSETEAGMAKILDHVAETGANVQFFRSSGNSIRHPSAFRPSYRSDIDKRKASIGDRFIFGWADFNRPEPDLLEIALRLGRDRGMRPYIHWPFEECHAPGFYKAFMAWNMKYPQFWGRTHSGQPWLGRVSLCYPEVIDYKLAILDELLARGAEGIFIHTFRAGMWGPWAEYVPAVTSAFREKYGEAPPENERDPRWCEHVADYVTELFRRMREHLDAYEKRTGRHVELLVGVAGIAPVRDAPGDSPMLYRAADWRAWVDMGIIDTLVMHSIDWDPKRPFETYREYGRQIMDYVDGRCKVHWPISAYSFRRKGLRHLTQLTKLPQVKVARRLMTIAWEEGGAGVSMECVDYNNYRLDTRNAIAELARTTCRTIKPWTPRGTAPPPDKQRIRPRPRMAPRRPSISGMIPALKRLATGPGNSSEGAWSPDGRTIAFQSNRSGEARIHLLDVASGAVTALDTGPGFSMFPAWTPDSKALVYAHGDLPKTAFRTIADAQPGWTGSHLHKIDSQLRNTLPGVNIRHTDVATHIHTQLTTGLVAEYLPVVTPDGRSVVFNSKWGVSGGLVEKENSMFIQRVGISGGSREDLFRQGGAYAVQPTLSPDGKYIVFGRLTSHAGIWHLMLTRVDNPSFAIRLTEATCAAYAPRWSPDGRLIAFTGYRDGDPGWGVYLLVPRPNALPIRVETGLESACNVSWSPDGAWLLFDSTASGKSELYRLPVSSIEQLPSEAAAPEALIQSRPTLSSDMRDAKMANAFDGDTNSYWHVTGLGHWLEISFGRPLELTGFNLHHGMLSYAGNPSGSSSAKGYRFQALQDTTWQDLIEPITDSPRYTGQGASSFVASHRFPPTKATRFRLLLTDTNDTGKRVRSPDKVCVPHKKRSIYLREVELFLEDGKRLTY